MHHNECTNSPVDLAYYSSTNELLLIIIMNWHKYQSAYLDVCTN